ncbi:hypothetical protein SEVIR_2G320075v4 [Setaria viridis]
MIASRSRGAPRPPTSSTAVRRAGGRRAGSESASTTTRGTHSLAETPRHPLGRARAIMQTAACRCPPVLSQVSGVPVPCPAGAFRLPAAASTRRRPRARARRRLAGAPGGVHPTHGRGTTRAGVDPSVSSAVACWQKKSFCQNGNAETTLA